MTDNTGNEPQPNIVINIDTAYNVNPAAKEVNNTFIIGAKEGKEAIAEALCTKNSTLYKGEPEENTDCMPICKEILNYVSRVSYEYLNHVNYEYFLKHDCYAIGGYYDCYAHLRNQNYENYETCESYETYGLQIADHTLEGS